MKVLLRVLMVWMVLAGILANENYGTTIKKVYWEPNPDYFVNGTYKVKPIRRYVSVVNLRSTLIKEMTTVWIRVKVFHKAATYQPFIINFFVDYCAFRNGTQENKFMEILVESLRRYSNNTHPCPFKPPEVFVLKEFVISTDIFPPIIPSGDYRLDFEYFMDKNMTVRYVLLQMYLNVRALKIVDLGMG